jgi:tetratricopeptide (TPR) repeat protein
LRPDLNEKQVSERIDTWKGIASHLRLSARTVQRWHTDYGLPVYHAGGATGAVYAYRDELEKWLRSRRGSDGLSPGEVAGLPANSGSEIRALSLEPETLIVPHPDRWHSSDQGRDDYASAIAKCFVPTSSRLNSAALVERANEMWHLISRNNLSMIARMFRAALDLDPGNAVAYAGLAHCLMLQGIIGAIPLATAYASATKAIRFGQELSPRAAEVRSAAGWLMVLFERDWIGADSVFRSLLSEYPHNPRVLVGYGLLNVTTASLELAAGQLFQAASENALSDFALGLHCWSEYLLGAYSEVRAHLSQARACGKTGFLLTAIGAMLAIQDPLTSGSLEQIKLIVEEDPENEVTHGVFGFQLARAGQSRQARQILEGLASDCRHTRNQPHYAMALVLLGLRDYEGSIGALEQSFKAGSLWSLALQDDPLLMPLHNHPRWNSLLTQFAYPRPTQVRTSRIAEM